MCKIKEQPKLPLSHNQKIDRIRLTVEREDNYTLDNVPSTPGALDAVDAPVNVDSTTASTRLDTARPIDIDNDGDNDFAVQLFRTEGTTDLSNGQPVAFELGVRVYTARAVDNPPASGLETESAAFNFTSGEGQGGARPLAVLYTSVVKSSGEESLCDYYRYIDPTASAPESC